MYIGSFTYAAASGYTRRSEDRSPVCNSEDRLAAQRARNAQRQRDYRARQSLERRQLSNDGNQQYQRLRRATNLDVEREATAERVRQQRARQSGLHGGLLNQLAIASTSSPDDE